MVRAFYMWNGCELWPEGRLWQISCKYCHQVLPFQDVHDVFTLRGGAYFPHLESEIGSWLALTNTSWQERGSRLLSPGFKRIDNLHFLSHRALSHYAGSLSLLLERCVEEGGGGSETILSIPSSFHLKTTTWLLQLTPLPWPLVSSSSLKES